jgi:hypothetical protein
MLMDMVAWMERQDGLFDTMNSIAMVTGGDEWSETGYVLLPDATDSDCAVEIFNIMNDLAGFLPKGHMWGFSEGRIGIFECRIKIVVTEAHSMPVARLKRLHRQFEIIEAAQKEIKAELDDIRDQDEVYRDSESVWIAVAAEMAYKMEAGNFSMGHVLRQITRAIARWR